MAKGHTAMVTGPLSAISRSRHLMRGSQSGIRQPIISLAIRSWAGRVHGGRQQINYFGALTSIVKQPNTTAEPRRKAATIQKLPVAAA